MSKTTTAIRIAELEAKVEELTAQLAEARKPREQRSNKKYDVLKLLQQGPHSTSELAEKMETSKNNIGSLLTYLRKQDGIILHKNENHQHYIAG